MRFEHFKKVCVTYNIFIYHRNVWHLMQVFNMIYKIFIICTRLHIFTSCFAQLAEFFILFDSCKSSSRHCSNAQRPGCILNISLDCCTILRMDSLGVLVAHEFVSTRWYKSPSVAYHPVLRSVSITYRACVYFCCAITVFTLISFCLLYLRGFSFVG